MNSSMPTTPLKGVWTKAAALARRHLSHQKSGVNSCSRLFGTHRRSQKGSWQGKCLDPYEAEQSAEKIPSLFHFSTGYLSTTATNQTLPPAQLPRCGFQGGAGGVQGGGVGGVGGEVGGLGGVGGEVVEEFAGVAATDVGKAVGDDGLPGSGEVAVFLVEGAGAFVDSAAKFGVGGGDWLGAVGPG